MSKDRLKKEQYEKLKKYDAILMKASKRMYLTEQEKQSLINIKPVYESIAGKMPKRTCGACGSSYTWINRIGEWYRDYKLNNE